MPRKAVARKISYKDARSYRRTTPNPMGVTSIAAVNRSKSYARRYDAARNILTGKARARRNRAAGKRRSLKQLAADMRKKGFPETHIQHSVAAAARAQGMSEAQIRKEGFDPAKLPGRPGAAAGKKTAAKAAKEETKVARKARKKTKKKVAKKRTKKKVAKKRKVTKKVARKRPARKKKVTKKRKVAKKVARKRPARKKKVTKKVARKRPARKKKVAKKKVAKKKVAKKLTPKQRAARSKRRCLAEERKKAASLRKAAQTRRRKERVKKAKAKLTRRQARPRYYPVGKGTEVWAPTVRITPANIKDAYVYESRAGTLRKIPMHSLAGYHTKRQMEKAITGNTEEAVAERERVALLYKRIADRRSKAADRMRKSGGIFTPNRRRGRGKTRALTFEEWESMKSNKRRRRRKRRKTGRKTYTRNLTARQRAALAKGRRKAATQRKPVRRNRVTQAAANKRRRRKVSRRPRTTYRSYRRNQALAGTYQNQLMQALKLGGVITAGYLVHRALTKVVQQSVFAETQYGELISGALVAAVGVPLSVKVAPGDSKLVSAGMMVSLVHSGIMTLLKAVDTNGTLAPYLSGFGQSYGQRPGRMIPAGMGSYYAFTPHQQMGEYFQPPMAGMGQFEQAAAGMGQMMQAAAGVGQLTQAAAGAGEYLAVGAEGIGEYEEVTPEYTRPVPVDEGISPDLSTAEQALSVAEAAAGVGGMGATPYEGVPAMSTVNPTGFAMPVKDAPGGSRAGVFAGKGVFGPTS